MQYYYAWNSEYTDKWVNPEVSNIHDKGWEGENEQREENKVLTSLNPNSIWVIKYSSIVLGEGGGQSEHVFVLTFLFVIGHYWYIINFELKIDVFVMTKAASNRNICFIKAV